LSYSTFDYKTSPSKLWKTRFNGIIIFQTYKRLGEQSSEKINFRQKDQECHNISNKNLENHRSRTCVLKLEIHGVTNVFLIYQSHWSTKRSLQSSKFHNHVINQDYQYLVFCLLSYKELYHHTSRGWFSKQDAVVCYQLGTKIFASEQFTFGGSLGQIFEISKVFPTSEALKNTYPDAVYPVCSDSKQQLPQ